MVDVLALGAHPDDVEFGCGAILSRLAAEGKSLAIVDLCRGEKASNGTAQERQEEGLKAAAVIGAEREFLDFPDCGMSDTYEGRLKLVEVFRRRKPKLVIAPLWKGEQNHPDHIACGLMARYACRYARFKNLLPNSPIHHIEGILHYPPPVDTQVDFLIDVSDYIETWKIMMACHESQYNTYPYNEWCLKQAAHYGLMINKPFAQALVKGNPVVVEDLMSVSCSTREI